MPEKLKDIIAQLEQSGGLDAASGVAGDALAAVTSNSKYNGASTGKAVGGGIGAVAGAFIGMPGVGQMVGSTIGGLIGGKSDKEKMIDDFESVNRKRYSGLNLSANLNPYGAGNAYYMAEGGVVGDGEGDDPLKSQKQFFTNYINSPKYAERLKKQGYTDIKGTKKARLAQVNATQYTEMPDNEDGSNWVHGPRGNTVVYDPLQTKQNKFNKSTVLSHEMSHAAGARGSFMHRDNQLNDLTMNRYEISAFDMRNKMLNQDANIKTEDIPSIEEFNHDSMAQEGKADMDSLRYLLKKDGIYDTGTQDFKPGDLKKAKEKYGSDPTIKRLFKNYKDKDLIYLMNNIASNNQQSTIPFAEDGMLVDGGGDDPLISIKDSKGLKTGNYPRSRVQGVAMAAKAVGVDPYTAMALALQETSYGTHKNEGPRGRRNRSSIGSVDDNLFEQKDLDAMEKIFAGNPNLDRDSVRLAYALKMKQAYGKSLGYKDEATQLQAYQGYGMITPKLYGGSKKAFGVDISQGVDPRKNPLYGKRLLELRTDLMNNKDIASLLTFQDGGLVGGGPGDLNIDSTLNANRKIPFVDRIVNAKKYPVRKNPDGTVSTHLMASASDDIGAFAYPTLRLVNNKWIENKDPKDAMKAGDYIRFNSDKDADYFARNYKTATNSAIKTFKNGGMVDYLGNEPVAQLPGNVKVKRGGVLNMYGQGAQPMYDPMSALTGMMGAPSAQGASFNNIVGNMQMNMYAEGGPVAGEQTSRPVNIEKGEILIDPMSLDVIRKFENPNRYSKHAKDIMEEPVGNFALLPENSVVIPRKHAEQYEKGDLLTRSSIARTILNDFQKHPETRVRHMQQGGAVLHAGDGSPVPKMLQPVRMPGMAEFNPIPGILSGDTGMPFGGRQGVITDRVLPGGGFTPPSVASRNNIVTSAGQAGGNSQPAGDGGNNMALGVSRALSALPTAFGLASAFGRDPYLHYDENTQIDQAKSYVQGMETTPNIDASMAAMRRTSASRNQALNNFNSPSVRAELAAGHSDQLMAEGSLIQNASNQAMQMRNAKRESLARLEDAQGTGRLNMRQKLMDELRMDEANRTGMIQQGLSEFSQNYGQQTMDNERLRALNSMTEYYKVDPNKKELMQDQHLFDDRVMEMMGQLFGGVRTNAGFTPKTKVESVTRDRTGALKQTTNTTTSKPR